MSCSHGLSEFWCFLIDEDENMKKDDDDVFSLLVWME